MIRELVLLAGLSYLIIALVQLMLNQTVRLESIVIGAALIAVSLVHWAPDCEWLKQWEMAALWIAVALFVGYALAKAGGIA